MKKIFIISLILVILASLASYIFYEQKVKSATKFDCVGELSSKFDCYRAYYSSLVQEKGIEKAFDDLKTRYEKNSYVNSQCHQIVHVLGYQASKKFNEVADAYKEGDSFCWSGYYHGVLEEVSSRIGYENLVKKINDICKPLRDVGRYAFNHYNCVHGLGHGIMALKDDELFESLEVCNGLSDDWEQKSCWSGAFMENVMQDNRYHKSKYLKPEDPLYPCNAVDNKYKNTCYLMQTSYMLTVTNSNFSKVFELCSTIEKEYRHSCYRSLGRDASGRSISDVNQTKKWCSLGKEYEQVENCIIGAVKDFISYLHSDTRAKEFCMTWEDEDLRNTCLETADTYYKNF